MSKTTITYEQLTQAAEQAATYARRSECGDWVKVAVGPEFCWSNLSDQPIGDPRRATSVDLKCITFQVRRLVIDGTRVKALYYNDLLMRLVA